MNKIRRWYLNNYTEITWFIIGFLTYDLLQCLSRGNYVGAAISFVLIGLNVSLSKK